MPDFSASVFSRTQLHWKNRRHHGLATSQSRASSRLFGTHQEQGTAALPGTGAPQHRAALDASLKGIEGMIISVRAARSELMSTVVCSFVDASHKSDVTATQRLPVVVMSLSLCSGRLSAEAASTELAAGCPAHCRVCTYFFISRTAMRIRLESLTLKRRCACSRFSHYVRRR
jgi:hypothetical protein